MKQKSSFKRLRISYLGSVFFIAFFLLLNQIIIQFALYQEIQQRNVAGLVNDQELRTQRMFYNVLLLQNPTGYGINYMSIYQLVKQDESVWESTQNAMYISNPSIGLSPDDFSSNAITILMKEQPGYFQLRQAYLHIFALEQLNHPASPDSVRPDVDTIYIGEGKYLQSLVTVYSDLTNQADEKVAHIQLAEITLCTVSFLTLFLEYFFVARKALIFVEKGFQDLDGAISTFTLQKEDLSKETESVPEENG